MSGGRRELSYVVRSVFVCYFFSGALGLTYQILWLRKLLLVFGSSVFAVSTVLTVFFGGLAIGSWLFGRLIDRKPNDAGRPAAPESSQMGAAQAGLRWYAVLEIGIGLYAFITLPLFDLVQYIYIPIYQASGLSPTVLVGASFACSAAILLIPTILLGGTFPLLSRFLIRSTEERGTRIASLYAINTAGAMAGTLFVYYVGLSVLGLSNTLLCAGVLNIGIGLLCFVYDRHLRRLGFHAAGGGRPAAHRARHSAATPMVAAPQAAPSPPADESLSGGQLEPQTEVRWLFAAFALSGFSAMVYEVAWTRALSLVLGSSIYAFCIMLATFLGGIAMGSMIARRQLRIRPATIRQFVWYEMLLGAYGFISILLFILLPDWFVTLWPLTGRSFIGISWLQVTLSASVMLLPAVILGVLFPVVSDLVTRRFSQLGQRLGNAYAVNTVGGIVGSFLSGFVLIPFLGLPWAIAIAAMINLLAGFIVYVRFGEAGRRLPRLALAGVSLLSAVALSTSFVIPLWQRQVLVSGVYLNPENYQQGVYHATANSKLLYYRDSFNATVSVHQTGDEIFLKVGGKTDASTGLDMGTQVLSAQIPMLLHKDPRRVLVIGLGSGVTLGHVGRYPASTIHCAEIEPAVIEAARYFKEYNYGIHDDPRTTIFVADGRNFLLASPEQYDVIISEPSNPWMAGLAYLFTQEFYQLAKRRLAPGGIMCQWLQLYRIFPSDVKLMLKTFHEEFPHVSVWSTIPGDIVLVGSMEPHQVDYADLSARMASPKIRESLAIVHTETPELLLESYWLGTREVEELTADVPWIHQDDLPWVEFTEILALYVQGTHLVNYGGLAGFKGEPRTLVPDYDGHPETAEFYLSSAARLGFRGEPKAQRDALKKAIVLDPGSSDTWLRLGEVYTRTRQLLPAQEALREAARLSPESPAPLQRLARIACQQQQFEEAQALFEQAASRQAPESMLAEEIGGCLARGRQFAWAAEYYRSAISQGGGARSLLVAAYAGVLMELERWEAAEGVLRFGAGAFPRDASFPLLLGNVLLEQERMVEASSWFEQVLTLAPNSPEAYYGLSRVLLHLGKMEEGAVLLRRVLVEKPYHREALKLLQQTEI